MKVIRTTEGYMIEKDDGDYLCDAHGDNTWEKGQKPMRSWLCD